MEKYKSKKAVVEDVRLRLGAIEGMEESDLDVILEQLLVRQMVRNALASGAFEKELAARAKRKLNPKETLAWLDELLQKDQGIRVLAGICSECSQDAHELQNALDVLLLAPEERSRVTWIVEILKPVMVSPEGRALQVGPPDLSKNVTRILNPAAVENFFTALKDYRRFADPVAAILPVDRLEELLERGLPQPQDFAQLLADEGYYVAAVAHFEKTGPAYLADLARLCRYYARLIFGTGSEDGFAVEYAAEIHAVLERTEQLTEEQLKPFEPYGDMVGMFQGVVKMALGIAPALPLEERARYLEESERRFRKLSTAFFRCYSPMVCWVRAQMFDGPKREQIELEAMSQVNELLAQSALIAAPTERLGSMTMLMSMTPRWKFARGDFRGAIECAQTARALGQSCLEAYRQEVEPTLEEVDKTLANPETEDEERQQARLLRDNMVAGFQGISSMTAAADLVMRSSQAKLAESAGDFDRADQLYQETSELEKKLNAQFVNLLKTLLGQTALAAKFPEQSLENQARATSFHGLALLNRGDRLLMEGDYPGAMQQYGEAQLAFGESMKMWARESERLAGASPQPQARALRELSASQSRIRYCDAKTETARGEQMAYLDKPSEAAIFFSKSATILAELVTPGSGPDDLRNLELFRASEDLCRGRSLLEMSRASRNTDEAGMQEGGRLLGSAALRFEKCGEVRWARYVRAMHCQYGMVIAWSLAEANPGRAEVMRGAALAKGQEALALFRELGMEKTAKSIETWLSSSILRPSWVVLPFPLPKPTELPAASANPAQVMLEQITAAAPSRLGGTRAVDLNAMERRAVAQQRAIGELKQMQARGQLDEARYLGLLTNYQEELIGTYQQIQSLLAGIDPELDALLRETVSLDDPDALWDHLERIIKARKLAAGVAPKNGEFISGVIAVGKNIAAMAVGA